MNNEPPVAWMSPDGKVSDTEGKLFYIPLYTHPVNPYQSITDTKIEPTVVSYTNPAEITDEEMYELLEKYQGIELCKAVLRKAQEK